LQQRRSSAFHDADVTTTCCWLQGYNDEEYKARRVMIANIARQHEM
jgi:hypothetical protein